MEKTIKLSKRLNAIASFIPEGARVIDVGTDHGYIPVWLAQKGTAVNIFASDLRPGPLDSARRTASEYGVTDKVEFILTDGLNGMADRNIDTVVIAGMGGETIMTILSAAPWVIEGEMHLVVQPQSKIPELLRWFDNNGIYVHDSILVEDECHIYMVLNAKVGKKRSHFVAEGYIPRRLVDRRDPLLYKYLVELSGKLKKKVLGLEKSKALENCELVEKLKKDIGSIEILKSEAEKWR